MLTIHLTKTSAILTIKPYEQGFRNVCPTIYINKKVTKSMATPSNTGHANNLASLNRLVKTVKEFGSKYNPAQESFQLVNIEKKLVLGQKVLNEQQAAEVVHTDAVNSRMLLYTELDKYAPRVVSIYAISGIDTKSIESVKAIYRKLHPQGSHKKQVATGSTTVVQTITHPNQQLGYEDKSSNFAQIASFVEANPKYVTNETELTKESVRKFSADLIAVNDRCVAAESALETARNERDKVFYLNEDSLYNTFRNVKMYIKGVYGPSSVEFKRVSGIEFKLLAK